VSVVDDSVPARLRSGERVAVLAMRRAARACVPWTTSGRETRRKSRSSVTTAGIIPLLLAVLAFSASFIASASLPDQTWVGGLYDGADDDTVLLLVWEQCPGLPAMAIMVPSPAVAEIVAPAAHSSHVARHIVLRQSRAPPLA
jgi:hypothetical protein